MKKLLAILVAIAFVASFASCSKTCSCTEAKTGEFESGPIKVLGVKLYKNCKEWAKDLNQYEVWDKNAGEYGEYVTPDWTCK